MIIARGNLSGKGNLEIACGFQIDTKPGMLFLVKRGIGPGRAEEYKSWDVSTWGQESCSTGFIYTEPEQRVASTRARRQYHAEEPAVCQGSNLDIDSSLSVSYQHGCIYSRGRWVGVTSRT